jgi:Uma2 family endonuclease
MLTSTERIQKTTSPQPQVFSLEDFLNHPLENMEWVDGQLIEKTGMTLRHSLIQARLARSWGNHMLSSHQGGEVYTEALCRTNKQGRRQQCFLFDSGTIDPICECNFSTPKLSLNCRNSFT